jgi:hypothetical protein
MSGQGKEVLVTKAVDYLVTTFDQLASTRYTSDDQFLAIGYEVLRLVRMNSRFTERMIAAGALPIIETAMERRFGIDQTRTRNKKHPPTVVQVWEVILQMLQNST